MDAQSSTPSAPERRVVGRPFQKGVSGNPGGRSKDDIDVAALARSKGAKAIAALERALDDPKHYVMAAIALLDRGYGRPRQMVDVGGDANSHILSHLLAARLVSQIEAEQAQQGTNRTTPPTIDGTAVSGPSRPNDANGSPTPNIYEPALE